MRVLYSAIATTVGAFSLAALLAMTVPAPSSDGKLTAELGAVTVITVETPPPLAISNDRLEMKSGSC